MRSPRSLLAPVLAAFLLIAGLAIVGLPLAAQEEIKIPAQHWSFEGIFGTPDLAAAQRGFEVYSEVWSNCHAMRQLHYRDLTGLGFTDEQVKAIASGFTVPQGLDDAGQPKEGPATPANQFRSPFPNEKAARAALNGAYPPDLSLILNARPDGANYLHAVMTGHPEPPT